MSKQETVEVPIDKETYVLAEKHARKLGRTIEEFVVEAIQEGIDREKCKGAESK